MEASIPIMPVTIINSISVKPPWSLLALRPFPFRSKAASTLLKNLSVE